MKKPIEVTFCDWPGCNERATLICKNCHKDLCHEHHESLNIQPGSQRNVAGWFKMEMWNICPSCAQALKEEKMLLTFVLRGEGMPIWKA